MIAKLRRYSRKISYLAKLTRVCEACWHYYRVSSAYKYRKSCIDRCETRLHTLELKKTKDGRAGITLYTSWFLISEWDRVVLG